jgi:hypothetical protein
LEVVAEFCPSSHMASLLESFKKLERRRRKPEPQDSTSKDDVVSEVAFAVEEFKSLDKPASMGSRADGFGSTKRLQKSV